MSWFTVYIVQAHLLQCNNHFKGDGDPVECFIIPSPMVSGGAIMGEVVFWVAVVSLLSALSFRSLRRMEKDGAVPSIRSQRQLLRSLVMQVR